MPKIATQPRKQTVGPQGEWPQVHFGMPQDHQGSSFSSHPVCPILWRVRILVVEDEAKMAALLRRGLEEENYAVDVAATAEDAVWRGTGTAYDAVILDVMLPDGSGFDVLKRLRQEKCWAPVLMLTARDGVADRVAGLDGGADDYLTKPFSFDELLARLRALLRRPAGERPAVLTAGELELDPAARCVKVGGTAVSLTAREFTLLEYLMRARC
jgi:two-component system, OmpR family, response regulator